MPWASAEVQAGHFDMIYHVGDFAYDFDSNNGTTGKPEQRKRSCDGTPSHSSYDDVRMLS
jgi:hypothetical protein